MIFGGSGELYMWLYLACIITFALFAYDKHCARYGKWRIPEIALMGCSLLLGAFGGLCAMIFFNHKTRKKLFSIGVPLLLLLQILGMAYLFTR